MDSTAAAETSKHIDPRCAKMAAKYPGFRVTGTKDGKYRPINKTIFATSDEALKYAIRYQKPDAPFLCVDYHWPFAKAEG